MGKVVVLALAVYSFVVALWYAYMARKAVTVDEDGLPTAGKRRGTFRDPHG